MSLIKRATPFYLRVQEWTRGHKRGLLSVGSLLLVAVLLVQLCYPSDQALLGSRLGSEYVQGKSHDELVRLTSAAFDEATVVLKAGDVSETVSLSYLGAVLEADATTNPLTDYPLWQRLLPLSIILKRPQVSHLEVTISDERLTEIADELAEKLSIPPQDAKLDIAGGELIVTESSAGQNVSSDDIVKVTSTSTFSFTTTEIQVPSEDDEPGVKDEDIAALRSRAEEIIRRQLTVVAPDGREFSPTRDEIASWLSVAAKEDGAKPELGINRDSMGGFIAKLNDSIGVKPGTAKATIVDGKEVSRTEAPSGLAVAGDELINDLTKALFSGEAETKLVARLVPVSPIVVYDRQYTSTEKGLQEFVKYLSETENMRIAVSQVKKGGWSAYGRADEQTVAASTYKLYVALMLFEQIEHGKLGWGDGMQGTNVDGCLERMIVHSDNPCAEEWIDRFGAKALNAFLYGKGVSQKTTFLSSVAAQTTAADLEKVLRGIESGSLVGGSDREKLLGLMERQRFRSGIPAGSAGSVQDKVGFLWDYLHDAAIVRHPKGTYVVVIMTKGSSWQRIAEVTRQIEQIMYS